MGTSYRAFAIVLIIAGTFLIWENGPLLFESCSSRIATPPEPPTVVYTDVNDTKGNILERYRKAFNKVNPVMDDPIDEEKLLSQLNDIVEIQKRMEHDDMLKHTSEYNKLWAAMDSKINTIRHYFIQRYDIKLEQASTVEDVQAVYDKVFNDQKYPYNVWPDEMTLELFVEKINNKKASIEEQ